ncbi:damage-inducible protein CinA [Sulfuriferula sp. AH1]|uniref:CinA family protein n=1 Tax=Sulfuriferula sp. AH1 TaxID=1985873 RepID=UPI000B3B8F7D|nr:nicotinamide-nucleotide amidohydrolase family protein [Sulfuriferula sp. AH1]ARU30959.1 damage-inducible protein CinA [Sulfuriferula sp. AH1]
MRPTDSELHQLAEQVGHALKRHGYQLVTAESCTGGWVGMVMTAIPGSSNWYDRGFITYSNDAKQMQLDVSAETLDTQGAVSEATVREMAKGALQHSKANISLAISGIAGPGGGTPYKPVGTVCIAWATTDGKHLETTCRLSGDRDEIRARAVAAALRGVIELLA